MTSFAPMTNTCLDFSKPEYIDSDLQARIGQLGLQGSQKTTEDSLRLHEVWECVLHEFPTKACKNGGNFVPHFSVSTKSNHSAIAVYTALGHPVFSKI